MHFYPGVAQYDEPDKAPYTIFINENTIRKMDPSFAGCPVFVEHVDSVEDDLNKLRSEADGWVIESFYNAADGKHWVKFIATSDKAVSAIRRGLRLSNSYFPTGFGSEGVWNGVSYSKEITDGTYDHLAIVDNPRYEESLIMTPEEFKSYNEEKQKELMKLANSKEQKEKKTMGSKFNFFKRTKVDNSADFESMTIELPKSKKEMTLEKVINEFDAIMNMHGYANGDHLVKINDKEEMSVNDLIKKHQAMCQEADDMKKKNAAAEEGADDDDKKKNDDDEDKKENDGDEEEDPGMDNADLDIDQMGDVGDRGGDKHLKNEDEEESEGKDKKKKNEDSEEKKKNEARKKAAALRNANTRVQEEEVARVELPEDQVARGKSRYGSN